MYLSFYIKNSILFNIVLEVLNAAKKKERKKEINQTRKRNKRNPHLKGRNKSVTVYR